MTPAVPASPADDATALPPPDGTVALNLGAAALFVVVVTVALVLDWVALKGVFVVGFLSVALAYLVLPVVQILRRRGMPGLGWRPSRILAVLLVYACVAIIVTPVWAIWGHKITSQVPDVAREVPRQVARFVSQIRASEQWHRQFAFERQTREFVESTTHRLSQRIQAEVAQVGAEVIRARLVVPWLAGVPLIALLLVSQWPVFHRSAARAVPNPHLRWRTDQLLRQVNMVLASYTRAQAISALIIGTLCGVGFALMKLPNAAMLGIVAGLLETIPIAGPLAVAISATSVASSSQVFLVLGFLGALRVLQDYVIYPRLIRRAMHLHPVGVVLAIWIGATVGGVIGVCLAVPTVGVLQVLWRNYREYRDIERLVREHEAQRVRSSQVSR
ncbi:MAG TPA: AI-2E family transporter [Vicinamibacterales bacterium]|nr:AI-2E family transporter [Vicinamibacterales bacterium]